MGKILLVNLTKKTIKYIGYPESFRDQYLGGRGFNSAILYQFRGVAPESPLSPDNVICVSSGPLAGTSWPSSGRTTVSVLKSPVTLGFADGNLGGHFGPAIRLAGTDSIVIIGRASSPVVLTIGFARPTAIVEIGDGLWETGTSIFNVVAKKLYGENAKVLSIGKAGANKVFCATVSCDLRVAGGGGTGAVFGSKNLKGIVVNYDPEVSAEVGKRFDSVAFNAVKKIKRHPVYDIFRKYGTTMLVALHVGLNYLPTKNWTQKTWDSWKLISGEHLLKKWIRDDPKYLSKLEQLEVDKELGCRNCPITCSNPKKVEYETLNNLGSKLGISDLDFILKLNTVYFNDPGLDVIQSTSIISALMEMWNDGVSNYAFGWGDKEHVRDFISDLANVSDENGTIGKYFVDGFLLGMSRAIKAKVLIFTSQRAISDYFVSVKNNAMSGVYPSHENKGVALAVATSSRGADHLRSLPTLSTYASWYIGKSGDSRWRKITSISSMPFSSLMMMRKDAKFILGKLYKTYNKTFGVPKPIAAQWEKSGFLTNEDQYVGWGSMIKYCQELYAVADALGICKFTTSWRFGLGPEDFARALSLLFRKPVSWKQVLEVGERIYTIERELCCTEKDGFVNDDLPKRFFVGEGSVDKKHFIKMLLDYYCECSYGIWGTPSMELRKRLNINFEDKFFSEIVDFLRD